MTGISETETGVRGRVPQDFGNNDGAENMVACMDKFARSFEASARRWELVVYPSLLAFIVLASYGFFLIYTLSKDVGRVADQMDRMVFSIERVSGNMNAMTGTMHAIAADINTEADIMHDMASSMTDMNISMRSMTVPVHHMRDDMSRMRHNVRNMTGPMNMVSKIFPF